METGVQNSEGTKFYAGLYLRTRNGTRFWGWGRPRLNEFGQQARKQDREQDHQQEQEQAGRPWANLADWLRVAHSSTFFQQSSVKPGESASVKAPENTPFPVQLALSGSPRTKRRMRFVWERRFIGLVIR